MDWTALLANAEIIDSPGRAAAVKLATVKSAAKAMIKKGVKASRGSRP